MESDPRPIVARARPRLSLLILGGALGALAFPTTDWWLFAWIWLVPALVCGLSRSPRGALADGWLAGTVFYLVLLRWLDHTFRHYSEIPWPITWLPIVSLAAYCGLYTGLMAAAVAWLRERIGAGPALACAPAFWVAGEWVRGHLMDGFPWGLLGYAQHGGLPGIQIAELAGVYGVSFVIVAVNAAMAGLVGLGWRRAYPGALAAALAIAAVLGFGWAALARERSAAAREVGVGL